MIEDENRSIVEEPVEEPVEATEEAPGEDAGGEPEAEPGAEPGEEPEEAPDIPEEWEEKLRPFRALREQINEHDELMADMLYEMTLLELGGAEED